MNIDLKCIIMALDMVAFDLKKEKICEYRSKMHYYSFGFHFLNS